MRATIDGPATGSSTAIWGRYDAAVRHRPPPCGSRSYHTGDYPILGLLAWCPRRTGAAQAPPRCRSRHHSGRHSRSCFAALAALATSCNALPVGGIAEVTIIDRSTGVALRRDTQTRYRPRRA